MVGWRWMLLRSLLRKIPFIACWVEVVNLSMKSGMACVRGSRIPRPPAFKLSCAINEEGVMREDGDAADVG